MGNRSASQVSVSCILSSGVFVTTLSLPGSSSVLELKKHLRSLSLDSQPEPNGRLFAYQGEELKDSTKLRKVVKPVCILRSSDRVVVGLDLSSRATTTVINTEENIYWGSPQYLSLLLFSHNWNVLLCDALPTETVSSLKERLKKAVSRRKGELKLWYKGAMLADHELLGCYNFGDRNALVLQLPEDLLVLARDLEDRIAVFPAPEGGNLNDLSEIAKFCEPKWRHLTTTHEYFCLCSQFPNIPRYLLQNSACSTLISLLFLNSPPTSLLIPSKSTVEIVKNCLKSQHNLSSPHLSLTAIGELSKDMTFRDFKPLNGDVLTIFKQKYCGKQLTATVFLTDIFYTSRLFHADDNIGRFVYMYGWGQDGPYSLMRGAEVLDRAKTFAECGIVADVQLTLCTSKEVMQKRRKMSQFDIIYSETNADSPLLNVIKVQLITSEAVLKLQVPVQVPVQTLLAHFHTAVPAQLVHAGRALHSNQSLAEQGVGEGSELLLVPADCVWVQLQTPAGGRVAVVLQPLETMWVLDRVLEELLGVCSYRLLFAQQLTQDKEELPAATQTLAISLQETSQ